MFAAKAEADATPAKVTGIKVTNAHDGIILLTGYNGYVDIAVEFETGKKARPIELNISAQHPVDFKESSTVLGQNVPSCKVTTQADGTCRLHVSFLACGKKEVQVKVSVKNSDASAKVILKYKMF